MRQIVEKNDGSIPIDDILCTTYQMRNFYKQLGYGLPEKLDIMNYIQHYKATLMMKRGQTVLDLCCGRGLLLPMMRYYAKDIKKYIGVDIKKGNMEAMHSAVNIQIEKDIDSETYYPFETEWIVGDVSRIAEIIKEQIDFIVYTSSIEHMHKDGGEASIKGCGEILRRGGKIFLSCPNTPEDRDGYDVVYKAHVYEWKLSELKQILNDSGFVIKEIFGLTGEIRLLKKKFKTVPKPIYDFFDPIIRYQPTSFLSAFIFAPFPELASEVLIIGELK